MVDEEYQEELGYYDGQVHRWLMKYRKLQADEQMLKDISQELVERADGVKSIRFDKESVSGGAPNVDAVHNAAEHIMEMRDLFKSLSEDASRKSRAIVDAVNAVQDDDSRHALLGHYIQGRTWESLCCEQGYQCSYRTMMRRRKRGLMEIYDRDLMPFSERDPRHHAI